MNSCAVLTLLVPNEDGTWYKYIDYRAINKLMVKYHYPIPHLDDILVN